MKQKLFLILICLLGISNVHAQFSVPTERSTKMQSGVTSAKKDNLQLRAATTGSIYFGYCGDYIVNGIGDGVTLAMSAAICMPASISGLYAGKTITKIRIGLSADCTDVSVWIRNSLTGANVVTQTVGDASKGWIEAVLPTPFTIPAGDFYIGYTATGLYQIGFSGDADYNGGWLQDDLYNKDWTNYSESGWGSLCIQALIDPQGATVLALKPMNIQKAVQGSPNQSITIQETLKSYSTVDITSVKVDYQIDNQAIVEKIIQTSIAPMKSGTIDIPINAIAVIGIYSLSIKVVEINGQSNVFANETLNSQIKILSQSFPRKVVMEEGTANWCGFCVRGAVGMALMKKNYPDTFIGIAVHDGDPMTFTDYDSYLTSNFIKGLPGGVLDRKSTLMVDPYPFPPTDAAFQSELALTPVAGIQLTGGFTDANKNAITLKTTTTFGISSTNANFRLAYVLIENGVTGYDQANFYAGGSMGVMGGYESKPNPVTDMVFNDVARGIYSEPTGISGSIPESITAMAPLSNTYTIDLPSTIQNKNQLEVAVLLINSTSEEIENADKIEINKIYTDIPSLITDERANIYMSNQNLYIESGVSETIDIYTVGGVKIYTTVKALGSIHVSSDHLPQGILIVKGSSGWVKKVRTR